MRESGRRKHGLSGEWKHRELGPDDNDNQRQGSLAA